MSDTPTNPQTETENNWIVVKNGQRVYGPTSLQEAETKANSLRTSLTESEKASVTVVQNIMG